MKDHFGISFCCKGVPLVNQILPEVLIIIDLSVKQQGLGAVLIENGLSAACKVDDGKPPEAQRNITVHIVIGVVRSPVPNGVCHGVQYAFIPLGVTVAEKANKSTHSFFDRPFCSVLFFAKEKQSAAALPKTGRNRALLSSISQKQPHRGRE